MVSSGSGSARSLTTSPLVIRSPKRSASAKSASTAGAKWEPKTSDVVVPARDEAGDELVGDRGGVRRRGEALLLRKGAPLEPLEQRHAEGADDPHLGEVDVGVDQAGQQQAVAEVDDRRRRGGRRAPRRRRRGR